MVSPADVPIAALTAFFRVLPGYVVLRNEARLFERLRQGGDVDLLVEDVVGAEALLLHHLGAPVRIARRSYVTEFFYDWGNVDLLPRIDWRGAGYLRTADILADSAVSPQGRPVPSHAHEAAIAWLTSLLWGGFFNDRYGGLIVEAAGTDGARLRRTLTEAAGSTWGERLWRAAADGHPERSAAWAWPIRRAVWWRAFRRAPLATVGGAIRFVAAEMQLRLAPRVPWMMVVGADGAGSLVDAVASRATGRYASFRIVGWPRAEGSTPQRLREYWTRVVHLRAKGYVVALATTGAPPAGVPAPDLIFRLEPRPGPAVAAVTPPARHRRGSTEHLIDPSLAPDVQATLLEGAVRAWLVARTGPASPSPDAAASVVAAASHPDGAPSC